MTKEEFFCIGAAAAMRGVMDGGAAPQTSHSFGYWSCYNQFQTLEEKLSFLTTLNCSIEDMLY